MANCRVTGCRNNKRNCKGKKSFFSFPKLDTDRERCLAWIHACRDKTFNVSNFKWSRDLLICEDHFTSDCFALSESQKMNRMLGIEDTQPNKKFLTVSAVPTVFSLSNVKADTSGSRTARCKDRGTKKVNLVNLKLIYLLSKINNV